MKFRTILITGLLLTLSLVLSSCSGSGAMTATSWPGFSVYEDKLYLSYQTGVYALNANNGTMIWKFPEKADTKRNYYAAPVLQGDQILVGDYLNSLHSLNSSNGTENWVYTTTNGRFIPSVTVVGETILSGSSDQKFYALDLKGNLGWEFKTNAANWAKPESDGTAAFLPSMDHHLYAVDLKNGDLLWKTDLGGADVSGLTLDGDLIFTGTLANELLAINKNDGVIVWRFSTNGSIWSRPMLKDGILYFADSASTIYAVDEKTGAVKWKLEQIGGPILGSGGLFEKGIVFGTEDGKLVAVDYSGQRLWEKQINGKLYSSPAVAGDKIIAGINNGDIVLRAFDFNGSDLWSFAIPK